MYNAIARTVYFYQTLKMLSAAEIEELGKKIQEEPEKVLSEVKKMKYEYGLQYESSFNENSRYAMYDSIYSLNEYIKAKEGN